MSSTFTRKTLVFCRLSVMERWYSNIWTKARCYRLQICFISLTSMFDEEALGRHR
jgi:hypothetical protein